MQSRMYWLHTITPLHVGSSRGADFVDLPIAREKITGWPIIPGSAVKGVWKSYFREQVKSQQPSDQDALDDFKLAFGGEDANDQVSALAVTDARLVLLPVRSYFGTFAYATSALALERLAQDLANAGIREVPEVPGGFAPEKALVPPGSVLVPQRRPSQAAAPQGAGRAPHAQGNGQVAGDDVPKVLLEELDFVAEESESAAKWAKFLAEQVFPKIGSCDAGSPGAGNGNRDAGSPGAGLGAGSSAASLAGPQLQQRQQQRQLMLQERFVILPDASFDFLCETGTEVQAHIRMESELKKVAKGALWYEESLPPETVSSGLVWVDSLLAGGEAGGRHLLDTFCRQPFTCQMGGKATVGKGFVECAFDGGKS